MTKRYQGLYPNLVVALAVAAFAASIPFASGGGTSRWLRVANRPIPPWYASGRRSQQSLQRNAA